MKFAGTILTFLGMASLAFPGEAITPEIDGSSLASGLTLISGALLIARASRKRN